MRILGAVVALSVCGPSMQVQSAELVPILEIVLEEQSPAMISYALKRCSAAYTVLSGLMLIEGGDADLSKQSGEMGTAFFTAIGLHAENNELAYDNAGVVGVIGDMAKLYMDEMQANYVATGSRIGGVMEQDLQFCKDAHDAW